MNFAGETRVLDPKVRQLPLGLLVCSSPGEYFFSINDQSFLGRKYRNMLNVSPSLSLQSRVRRLNIPFQCLKLSLKSYQGVSLSNSRQMRYFPHYLRPTDLVYLFIFL